MAASLGNHVRGDSVIAVVGAGLALALFYGLWFGLTALLRAQPDGDAPYRPPGREGRPVPAQARW
jgi:hypothetical protein